MKHALWLGYFVAAVLVSGCGNGFAKRSRELLGIYPAVHRVTPEAGGIKGGTEVVVNGTDFTEDTIAFFGETPCTSVTVESATQLKCLTPPNAAGSTKVIVRTGKSATESFNRFSYEPIPTADSVSPSAGSPSAGNTIVITGTGLLSAKSVTVGGNPCTNVNVISATKITCTVPAGDLGIVDIVVTNDEGPGTTTTPYVYSSTASVSSITPNGGPVSGGTAVTIKGAGFLPSASVKIGGVACTSPSVTSQSTITCNTGASSGEGFMDVEVINADLQTAVGAGLFFYEGAPTIASVSPSGGPTAGGTTLTMTGTRFLTATAATVGGVACTTFTVVNKTTATCVTPAHAAGAADVVITTTGGSATLTGGFLYAVTPTISSIAPLAGSASGGTVVTLTGTGFVAGATVKIGTTACTGAVVDSATQITCKTPAASAGAVYATVTNPDAQSGTGGTFTYNAAPVLSSVSPTSGPQTGGTTITVAGTGLLSVSEVKVGGATCGTLTAVSDISFTCVTPASLVAAAVAIDITNAAATSTSASAFTYNPPPAIKGTPSPAAGSELGGTTIRLLGTHFVAGATVTVGGNACTSVSVVSANEITCVTAAHAAGPSDIVVTNPDGQSVTSSNAFTFEGNATVTVVAPDYGSTAGGLAVTITGTQFSSATRVTFGGAVCGSMTVVSATSITCVTPAHAAGAVDVVVENGNGPATLASGFTYQDPTVTGVSPSAGGIAGGVSITITGTNFKASATVTVGGQPCTSVVVNSPTSITCTTPALAQGTSDIVVTNQHGGSGTLTGGYISDGAPTLTNVAPVIGPLGGGTTITLTGTRFSSATGVTVGGAACTSFTVVSATSATCVTPAHAAGAVDVVVTNATSTATSSGGFTYSGAPTIGSIAPGSIATGGGTTLTINGTGFVATPTVTIDGFSCGSVIWVSATQITCTAPAHVPGGTTLVVTNPDGQSASATDPVTYEGVPTVTSVSPVNGPQSGGTTLTVTGTGFKSVTEVRVAGVLCGSLTLVSATQVTCVTPVGLASGGVDVGVTNAAGTGTLLNGFLYDAAPSLTTGVSPLAGTIGGGTTIVLTGQNFVNGATITVGGSACTDVNFVSASSLTCTTPAHAAGAVNVVVTNPDGQLYTANNAFTYEAAPTLSAVTPTSGPVGGGKSILITGTNLLTTKGITLDGSACTSITVLSATTVRCTTPAHAAATVDIVVTNASGPQTLAASYTYNGVPTVTAISPKGGGTGGGTAVTISGTNFVGGATVTLGGVACTGPAVVNATTVTCTAGANAAGTGDVVVTNLDTSFGTGTLLFTYEAAPTLASISPANGPLAGGNTLTLNGTGFLSATGVTVDGAACTNLVKISATQLSCTPAAHAAGTVDVVITNETSFATLAASYTYAAPPTVASLLPSAGGTAGGTEITITGTGFVAGARVSVGTGSCANVTVLSATEITCVTSGALAGSASITVTNPDGQSGSGGTFTYEGAPTLTSISPAGGSTAGGNTITLTGTGFLSATGITVGGVACSAIGISSATQATCVVPAGAAATVAVAITNATSTANLAASYTYRAAPTVGSVLPVAGPFGGGTTITITGTNFLAGATVTVGGSACTNVNVATPTSITCLTPVGTAGVKSIVVTNADKQFGTGTNLFTYEGSPTISGVTPTAGSIAGGTLLTVNGTNLATTVLVKVDTQTCTGLAVVGPTQITCTTPAHAAGLVNVTLTNAGGTVTSTAAYTYKNAPTVASASPAVGSTAGGTVLTITGTNFVTGATVTVGGVACTPVTIVSSTQITCTTGAHAAGQVDVIVTSAEGQPGTGTNAFLYEAAPTVTTVTPNGGALGGGTAVTIDGTNFTSATSVLIGGRACSSLKVKSATQLTCATPSGSAGAKTVEVINPAGTGSLPSGYTYQGAPSLTLATPGQGPIAGGTTIVLSGTGLINGATVTVGGVACTSPTVSSASSMTCVTPAAAAGLAALKVTNPDGQASSPANLFTYEGAPTLSSIAPTSGPTTGGTTVTLTGTQYFTATGITIGGSACTSLRIVSATKATCIAPAMAAGAYDVVITNATSTATLAGGYTYQPVPTVSAIAPTSGSTGGGTAVTVTGTNFRAGATVKIGSQTCTGPVVVNATTITCTTGAATLGAGVYKVTVTNTGGDFGESASALYTYEAPAKVSSFTPTSGGSFGGLTITITGSNFLTVTGVTIGGTACTSLTIVSATQLTCVTPAKAAGAYVVAVTNAGGTGNAPASFSVVAFAARGNYVAQPTGDGRILIWGGAIAGGAGTNTGAMYDPVTNSWSPTSTTNAPIGRSRAVGQLVSGNRIFVWGGATTNSITSIGNGKLYKPSTDTWTDVSATNAPAARMDATYVSYEDRYVLVAGGTGNGTTTVGGAAFYDVDEDTWIAPRGSENLKTSGGSSFIGACAGNSNNSDYAVVWGGTSASPSYMKLASGYRTKVPPKATETWAASGSTAFPLDKKSTKPDFGSALVINRSLTEPKVWGGQDSSSSAGSTKIHTYNCVGNGEASWTTEDSGAPFGKFYMHPSTQAIFQTTGSNPNFHEMLVWGWGASNAVFSTGGFTVNSVNGKKTDFQAAVSTVGAPPGRGQHAVLTSFVPGVGVHDRKFYVFGGVGSGGFDGTHYMYNAATDTWSTIATP